MPNKKGEYLYRIRHNQVQQVVLKALVHYLECQAQLTELDSAILNREVLELQKVLDDRIVSHIKRQDNYAAGLIAKIHRKQAEQAETLRGEFKDFAKSKGWDAE